MENMAEKLNSNNRQGYWMKNPRTGQLTDYIGNHNLYRDFFTYARDMAAASDTADVDKNKFAAWRETYLAKPSAKRTQLMKDAVEVYKSNYKSTFQYFMDPPREPSIASDGWSRSKRAED